MWLVCWTRQYRGDKQRNLLHKGWINPQEIKDCPERAGRGRIDFMTQTQTWTYITAMITVLQLRAECDFNDLRQRDRKI